MTKIEYSFNIKPERREKAFFHVVLITYPLMVFRYLFCRKPSVDTFCYLFFSPFFILYNSCHVTLSNYLFYPDINYRIILYESHIAFGVGDDSDKLLANSYSSIKTFFKSDGHWAAIVHSGWIVYLPPNDDGEYIKKYIEEKIKDNKSLV